MEFLLYLFTTSCKNVQTKIKMVVGLKRLVQTLVKKSDSLKQQLRNRIERKKVDLKPMTQLVRDIVTKTVYFTLLLFSTLN